MLVVDEGAGPVGWAVGWAVPGELHVMNVAVHPDHRRRGHARALLATLVDLHRWSYKEGGACMPARLPGRPHIDRSSKPAS